MKQNIRREAHDSRRGSTLIVVAAVLPLLMLVALASLDTATQHCKAATDHLTERRAFYLADAGITEAVDVINQGGSGNLGSANLPVDMAGGLFWVEATDLGGGQVQLTGTALVETGRASVEVIVDLTGAFEGPLFDNVVNSSLAPLTLNSNVMVDSYDSKAGTYASQVVNVYDGVPYAGDRAWVRSASDIFVGTNTRVFGDAIPGPGQTVVLAGASSYVSGSTDPAASSFNFDPISPPAIVSGGPLTVPSGAPTVLPPGLHGFDALTIEMDGILLIEGPAELVVSSFEGMNKASLEIDARLGPVTIYVMGPYSHGVGFETNPVAGSPAAVAFMVAGVQDLTFPAGSAVRGAYYAPEATMTFGSNAEFWGAMTAAQVTMDSNMRFHFDESLLDYWLADTDQGDGKVDLSAWYRSALPENVSASRESDPYATLAVANSVTITAARAASLAEGPYTY